VRGYLGQTALGVALAAAAYAISLPLLWWMSPVIVGLLLAVPLAAFTARPDRALSALGLLAIPEERHPPEIVARANSLLAESATTAHDGDAVALLFGDPALLDLHRSMLVERARRRGDIEVDLVVALAKLEETGTLAEALEVLTPREKMALLSSRRGLDALIARATNCSAIVTRAQQTQTSS
jgi:membrane glycosyltransferase